MKLRNFKPSDLDDIRAMEPFMEMVEDWEEVASHAITYTVEDKGVPIACGGVIVGESAIFWVRTNGTKPVALFRGMRFAIKSLVNALGDMDYGAFVLEGFTKGKRLAEVLGFRKTDTTVEHDNHIYHRYELWPS